ncbi:stromal interaction molecule homolog isoform X5 [Penaeus chinensis]|uniref:stromal interaction molecule homolog isoform X5 n=1 Tax=Penaeus chinensis TaxID=139456 RepID=UPI001FB81CF5|nr:stromal interaction molecule homolog isoform X5 [Penaeus chinensis]
MALLFHSLLVHFALLSGVTCFGFSGYGTCKKEVEDIQVRLERVPEFAETVQRVERGGTGGGRGCVPVDELCLVPEEVPNYEAIKSLHSQLDDDRSGDIDVSESVEFLKEELQYAKGYEKRQKVFHSNNDQYISVRELWHMWKKSEVHNWTVEQTVTWLAESVELQQYAQNFYANAVNGSVLPRLAANNEQFLTKVLGIKDPKHRSKITIKAMDVVLFGPPKGSHVKDLVLVSLLTVALIGCFKAYQRNRQYEGQLSDMLRDMEKLREAEENLRHLEQRVQTNTKAEERQLSEENREHNEEVQLLKQQLEEEREKNEQMKEQMKWSAPRDLQHWLQLTYERERLAFEKKQRGAREQFSQARDLCEKLNRQRRSLIGMIASVNGKMENIDQSISQARTIMEEVTQELREREQRWQNIEILAGCSIITNAGLHALELMLRPQVNGRPHSSYAPSIGRSSRLSASLDDFDDDNLSLYTQASVHQLLSSQSALMFLTMGGCTGASSCYGGVAINSSGLGGTPRDSMVDVRGSVGSVRKRSQLLTRDSGSSLGSEASITQTTVMHHSQTYTAGMGLRTEEEECIRRANSTGSITVTDCPQSKDSESSTEETDGSACVSETTSFSMGGSRLTLNSECSRTISPVQVSSTTPAHTPANALPQTTSGGVLVKPSPKRSPMLKSFSQDTDASNTPGMRWKERDNISASEPALDSPRTSLMLNKKKGASPSEEGNSSDSSMMEERPPSADSRKKSKSWFRNGISSSLKFSRSKKLKETDKDSSKNNTKHLSADFCLHASQYAI